MKKKVERIFVQISISSNSKKCAAKGSIPFKFVVDRFWWSKERHLDFQWFHSNTHTQYTTQLKKLKINTNTQILVNFKPISNNHMKFFFWVKTNTQKKYSLFCEYFENEQKKWSDCNSNNLKWNLNLMIHVTFVLPFGFFFSFLKYTTVLFHILRTCVDFDQHLIVNKNGKHKFMKRNITTKTKTRKSYYFLLFCCLLLIIFFVFFWVYAWGKQKQIQQLSFET